MRYCEFKCLITLVGQKKSLTVKIQGDSYNLGIVESKYNT